MSCQCLCPLHCVPLKIEKKARALKSPHPELFLSNATIPLDSQIPTILSIIETAEELISAIDKQIELLQTTVSLLQRRRSRMHDVANNHRGAISALRRFPNEILIEIFLLCAEETMNPSHHSYTLRDIPQWNIATVCSRWRAVALSCPKLWCYVVLRDCERWPSRVPLQLERSNRAPLTLNLQSPDDYYFTPGVLELLLTESPRWQSVRLDLHPSALEYLRTISHYPALKKLEIFGDDPEDLFKSLPALEELTLCTFPHLMSEFPWSQLRKCAIRDCSSVNALRILSQLPSAAEFSVCKGHWQSKDHEQPKLPTTSKIEWLDLSGDKSFIEDVLSTLVATALKKLTLKVSKESDFQTILSFLNRSSCPITHLELLGLAIPDNELIEILQSSHQLVDLQISVESELSGPLLKRLTFGPEEFLVPRLQLLGFRGFITGSRYNKEHLFDMLRSRCAVLQSVRFSYSQLGLLSDNHVDALRAAGLEVSYPLRGW